MIDGTTLVVVIGMAVTAIVLWKKPELRKRLFDRLGWSQPVETPAIVVEPASDMAILPAIDGNIPIVKGEEMDRQLFGREIHEFPDTAPPLTPFEDFNRKLFIYSSGDAPGTWSKTGDNDFATHITGLTHEQLLEQVRFRLRPRYPVILDTCGYWAQASAQLEQRPDYRDDFVDTYLAIPLADRPVVVSAAAGNTGGTLCFMRYGFEDFELRLFQMRFFIPQCLTLLMAKMIAPRHDWLWLSVARMRQEVWKLASLEAAFREALIEVEQKEARIAADAEEGRKQQVHNSRFVTLFYGNSPELEQSRPLP